MFILGKTDSSPKGLHNIFFSPQEGGVCVCVCVKIYEFIPLLSVAYGWTFASDF